MILAPPSIRTDGDLVRYEAATTLSNVQSTLWYSVPSAFQEMVCDRADAAAVALLVPAMELGEDLRIEGPLSERIYYNISGPLQAALCLVMPHLKRIQVTAYDVVHPANRAIGVASGFSGGIDSFSVLYRHHFHPVSGGFRLTHLLFHDIATRRERAGEKRFTRRVRAITPLAQSIGLPLIPVDSNVCSFYQTLKFTATHTLRNASVALLLANGIGRYLYASGYSLEHLSLKDSRKIAVVDPAILPMISNEVVDCISADCELTRVEKTLRISTILQTREHLFVCGSAAGGDNRNCSRCAKCKRTMLTLELAGVLEQYRAVFDLDEYNKHRAALLRDVVMSRDVYLAEIKAFALTTGLVLPKRTWLDHMVQARRIFRKLLKV